MKLYIIGASVLFVIIRLFSTFGVVNSGEIGIKYSYGTIKEVLTEGTYFTIPFIESVDTIDIKTQKLEVETSARSKDLQTVNTAVALNYSVDKNLVMNLYREVGPDFVNRIVNPTMQEAIKSATSKYTAEELITKREAVKEGISNQIGAKLNPMGIKVQGLNITDFKFSKEFDEAVNQKVKAEQDALTQRNKLEQVKYEAQQTIEKAKAQAESIKIQAQSVSSQGGADYVKLKWIEKWDGELPKTSLGTESNTLFNLN